MRQRRASAVHALVLCLPAWGCSPVGRPWMSRRGKDLGDRFRVAAGVGGPVYARVKATDFAVAGGGLAIAHVFSARAAE